MFCKYSMITFNGKNNGNYFDIIKKENIDIMVLKEYAIFLVFKKFTFIYYLWGGCLYVYGAPCVCLVHTEFRKG